MAQERHVFTIIEGTDGAGIPLLGRAEGVAIGGNHVPAMVAKNLAGQYVLMQLRVEGAVASGVLATPGLVSKDPSGNLSYLKQNADGELIVSNSGGVKKFADNVILPAALDTAETVVEIALTVAKVYESPAVVVSSFHPCLWELVSEDDGTPVVEASWISGPGQFTVPLKFEQMEITAGATGVQKLLIKVTQLSGKLTDASAYLECIEKL